MLAEAKRRGREALLTFRMNDDHGNDFLRTQFLVDHPDWRLGTEQYRGKGAMDFGRDEVRDYTFRLIEEAVNRYDCDGIELDFNRFPTFFKDGTTDERVAKMNSLVERVRKMLDDVGRERGRRLVLGVRVPSNYGRTPPTPETARQLGCDVPAWVKHGWVDFVAVSEFLFERGDLPIGQWKQAIADGPGLRRHRMHAGRRPEEPLRRRIPPRGRATHASRVLTASTCSTSSPRARRSNAYEPPFEVLRDLAEPKPKPGSNTRTRACFSIAEQDDAPHEHDTPHTVAPGGRQRRAEYRDRVVVEVRDLPLEQVSQASCSAASRGVP